MSAEQVTLVRIYLTEGRHLAEDLVKQLHDQEKVQGVTVFRGVSGFGDSGRMHTSSLVDLSLDLPLVIEFYDQPDRVKQVLSHIREVVKPRHIVSWNATVESTE